jgi:predicted nucleotidyltransferase component of viral defense system
VIRATKETEAGRRYLDLQRKAKHTGRPTDELIQLYALEGFLDRLARSAHADRFVLKGGVLLAALDARRPTRDIDLAAHGLENRAEHVLLLIREIAAIAIADGLIFDAEHATAETIREDDHYSGVRVTLGGELSRATIRLHVDINVGDPIWPEPQQVRLPRLLDGTLLIRGYPLEMVFAEKIVTALTRGTANTRWRDFLDLYVLIRRHAVDAETLRTSIRHVAQYRGVSLSPLKPALAGFPDIAQSRWLAWLRKQRLETAAPAEFATVLELVISFADPLISNDPSATTWNPFAEAWGGTG